MVDVSIDNAVVHEIVQKAIFESLDAQKRDTLILQALEYLMTPPKKESYHSVQPPTPLQAAFNDAVRSISVQVVNDYLSDEKVKTAIRDRLLAALGETVSREGDWLYNSIGYAVGEKISNILQGER